VTVSVQSSGIIDRTAFFETLRRLDREILRLKGNVRFAEGVCFVEKVHRSVIEKEACSDLGGETAFAVIGWGRASRNCQTPLHPVGCRRRLNEQ